MRRPVYQLGHYHYNPVGGTMQGDRMHHLDTYQDTPLPQGTTPGTPPSPLPPIVININLGGILDGLGLGDLIRQLLAQGPARPVTEGRRRALEEGTLPRVSRRQLLEAIVRGGDPGEVADLMCYLDSLGALE